MCLVVRGENDNGVIMNSKIRPEEGYQRQQETLIVWQEPNGCDLALSFQEVNGCEDIWYVLDYTRFHFFNRISHLHLLPKSDPMVTDDFGLNIALPQPSLKNLQELEQTVSTAARNPYTRRHLVTAISETAFIENLLPLLEISEDLESFDDLYRLAAIMRDIICLNDSSVYEYVLKDDIFMKVVGILEYDREFPNMKASHREYLTNHAKFKEVVPIRNPNIVAKIKQTYRAQFLKDVVLARTLDDGTHSGLNQLAFFNQIDIVGYVQQDTEFLTELFAILDASPPDVERKKEAVLFLHEIAGIASSLQGMNRGAFFRTLGEHGLFSIFHHTLLDPDPRIRIAGVAILGFILKHDTSMIRSLCVAQTRQRDEVEKSARADTPSAPPLETPLVELLVKCFLEEEDEGLRSQFADSLVKLLDTSPLDGTEGIVTHPAADAEGEEFLLSFYEKLIGVLLAPILTVDEIALTKADDGATDVLVLDERRASIVGLLCQIVCFAVRQHQIKMKFYIVTYNLLAKVAILLKAREAFVRLGALRVLRTCIGMKDEFYLRNMLKLDVFRAVVDAFEATKGRYNLFNSACLEFFEFIRAVSEGATLNIVAHLVTSFRTQFEGVGYVDTLK
ncbi:component of IIS longevity pathway SMK-1-domain-containing protein, partial [Blyttiomyces helicus]